MKAKKKAAQHRRPLAKNTDMILHPFNYTSSFILRTLKNFQKAGKPIPENGMLMI